MEIQTTTFSTRRTGKERSDLGGSQAPGAKGGLGGHGSSPRPALSGGVGYRKIIAPRLETVIVVLEKEPETRLWGAKDMGDGIRTNAAILFTDVVNFTVRLRENEDETLRLIERDKVAFEKICKQFGGHALRFKGDEWLMAFENAPDAMKCALAIRDYMYEVEKSSSRSEQLEHRIGIHYGPVTIKADDADGITVNIAKRIQENAKPRGISFSKEVHKEVAGVLKSFRDSAGRLVQPYGPYPKRLKNVHDMVFVLDIGRIPKVMLDDDEVPEEMKTAFEKEWKRRQEYDKEVKQRREKLVALTFSLAALALAIIGVFFVNDRTDGALLNTLIPHKQEAKEGFNDTDGAVPVRGEAQAPSKLSNVPLRTPKFDEGSTGITTGPNSGRIAPSRDVLPAQSSQPTPNSREESKPDNSSAPPPENDGKLAKGAYRSAPVAEETFLICEESGLRAGSKCTKTRSVKFKVGEEPKETCRAHGD